MKHIFSILLVSLLICFIPFNLEYNMATIQKVAPVSSATLQTGEKVSINIPAWVLPKIKENQVIHTYRRTSIFLNYETCVDLNDFTK